MEIGSSLMVSTPSSGPLSKFGQHLSLKMLNTNLNMSPTTSDYGTIGSPMSHLALNLSGLSTGDCLDDTPKRRLSLSSLDTPTPDRPPPVERITSTESGCFVDSPCSSPIDSPTIELSLTRFQASGISIDHQAGSYGRRRSLPFRRLTSLPKLPFCLSPTDDLDDDEMHHSSYSNDELSPCEKFSLKCNDMFIDDTSNICDDEADEKSLDCDQIGSINEGSQDSGISLDSHKDGDFHFAAPVGLAPRRHRAMFGDDTCSPLKYSPVKLQSNGGKATSLSFRSFSVSSGLDMKHKDEECEDDPGSPLKFSRLTSSDNDSDNEDDGFLDLVDKEVEEINDSILPFSFTSLFSGPVHSSSKKETCIKRVNCKIISRSQSFDIRSRTRRMKRPDPERDIDETTPIFKRRCSVQISPESNSTTSSPPQESHRVVKLKRCHSETEAFIKSALNRSTEDRSLIGDGSKKFCLPLVEGKHQDLKSISADTLHDLLSNQYDDEVSKCTVVDCRYPYEFEAGHIKNALNLYTKECIIRDFLTSPQETDDTSKRSIIVFHCEFSSERAPNLCRFLRNKDRDQNTEFYPRLHYPELYLLDGGYKAFYESHKEVCVPQDYMPMLHKEHREDLRKFRAKSRSWAGEKSRIGLRLGLKF